MTHSRKTFMIAIGNAGLDENNIVAAVTETINDLKDNKLTKTLSGYACLVMRTLSTVNGL
ncbi:MAG: hypothetical protein ACLTJ5_09170 [Clostridium sp.]